MDEKKARLLSTLRETFRVEASEHLEAITAGLLAVERAGDEESVAIAEKIFREAHSLKGAARSVNLSDAESVCAELESLFAAMKRGDLVSSPEVLDVIHPALAVLADLCRSPGASLSAEGQEKERQVLAALRRAVRGLPREVGTQPVIPVPSPPLDLGSQGGESEPQQPSRTRIGPDGVAPDTVRISTAKLNAILLEAEELLSSKLAAMEHADELRELTSQLADWNQGRLRRRGRDRGGGVRGDAAVSSTFEAELLYVRSLESSLRRLTVSSQEYARSLAAVTDRLLEDTKKALLLPCSYLLGPMPAIVRDLAREQRKEAELVVTGEDVEIDRRILDGLKVPLIHLLRNFVDHGVEGPDVREAAGKPRRGSIMIAVHPIDGGGIEFTIGDDGAGIDGARVRDAALELGVLTAAEARSATEEDLLKLVFRSGLSTSPTLTALSGRGLGLAIVREKIDELGGTIEVTSRAGVGTTFRLRVPLSLATFRGVMVVAAGQRFVFPSANVLRVCRISTDALKTVENRRTFRMGDRAVSVVRLREVLELTGIDDSVGKVSVSAVVIRSSGREVAFLVDEVLGEQEVRLKSLGRQLLRVRNIGGGSIASDGAVIPVLHAADLVESASLAAVPGRTFEATDAGSGKRMRLLLAEDSITSRTLVKSILEGADYEVVATVDGMDALTRLKTEAFDLVVSDIDMPRMNGFELTARIRADRKLSELPVVLVTALGSQQDREYGVEVGANAYIVKSDFDQSNLLEIIRRLL